MRQLFPRGLIAAFLSFLACFLSGCNTYVETPPTVVQPATVYVAPATPPPVYIPPPATVEVVEIHTASDFYEPLNPYGRWIEVNGYGRCWAPSGVDRDWRPYTHGHWQRTDAGWYWVSDEPWGWATCHYGRWNLDANFGWVWVPQTEWAPAWVAWRQGGGYTGWAPLPPHRPESFATPEPRVQTIDPHIFVFVEERKILEPQRPQTVIINNITIIQKTVIITKIVNVNKTVINAGPSPESVAQATGRQVDIVPAHSLRTRQETPAVTTQHLHAAESLKNNAPLIQKRQDLPRPAPPIARPNDIKPPATNMVFNPKPRPLVTNHVNQLPHQTNQLTAHAIEGQLKPELKSTAHLPNEHTNEIKKPGQPVLTAQQKLDLEKQRKALEKQRKEEAQSQPVSTNAPAPPR